MKDLYIVSEFRGPYRWLSNFHNVPIEFEDATYPSTENSYQAAKCANIEDRRLFLNVTSSTAKGLGRQVALRGDWTEELRLKLMYDFNYQKFFGDRCLRDKLIDTGDAILIEGNLWGDTFWGVDLKSGAGKNHLGKILMRVRRELLSWLDAYA